MTTVRGDVKVGSAPELTGRSASIQRLREQIEAAARRPGHVLIQADRGFDPERVARALSHAAGEATPFAAVQCGALDGAELERLLFGNRRRNTDDELETISPASSAGRARGGFLYLGDIAELPAPSQARLARLLRDGEARIDDPARSQPLDLRVLGGTARALEAEVTAGRFRDDLFRRLSAIRLQLPPLRQRPEDIPDLVATLMAAQCARAGTVPKELTRAALTLLAALPWPENVVELGAMVERLVTSVPGRTIQLEDVLALVRLDGASPPVAAAEGTLRDARRRFEREYIAAVLNHHEWRMGDAARALGIQRTNLYRKARQLGIVIRSVQS